MLEPSLAAALIIASPFVFAVTMPLASTVATKVLEDYQVTEPSNASSGATVADN